MICIKPWLYISTTPKCGSISLQHAYASTALGILKGPVRAQHMSVADIRRYHREFACHPHELEDHGEVTVIATVRDPVDWLASFHRYLATASWGPLDTSGMTFEAFILRWLSGSQVWMEPYRTLGEYANGADKLFDISELNQLGLWVAEVTGDAAVRVDHHHRSPQRRQPISAELEARVRAANRVTLN